LIVFGLVQEDTSEERSLRRGLASGGVAIDRKMPTVVVARSPVPGREAEFEQWLRRLVAAARRAPGHIHSDIQPPTDVHPGEWVILYQFADAESLHAWLTCEERDELVAEGRDLVTGGIREQVVALAHQPEPVTAVASFYVKPGSGTQYAELYNRLVSALMTFPGFIRSELFPPIPGIQEDTVVLLSFDTREHLDGWLDSRERERLLEEIDPYIEGGRTLNVVGGFAGWFGRPGMAEVKTWKQATIVLLAIIPISLLVTAVRRWLLPDVNWWTAVIVGNVVGVALLSWVAMPFLTRVFERWLRR
jgi:antibiotic biosynthesis monooxygenase (ABM) superfamily enzyme